MHLCAAFWPQEVVCTQLCKGKEEGQLRGGTPFQRQLCDSQRRQRIVALIRGRSREKGGGGGASTREGPEKDERSAADTGVHCFL